LFQHPSRRTPGRPRNQPDLAVALRMNRWLRARRGNGP
jgi:hypothetical protein